MDLIDNSNITSIKEKTYTNENGDTVIEKIIYVKPSPAIATAQRRYYENNKEKINEYNKIYLHKKYYSDPEYREKLLARKREAYARKKEEKNKSQNGD